MRRILILLLALFCLPLAAGWFSDPPEPGLRNLKVKVSPQAAEGDRLNSLDIDLEIRLAGPKGTKLLIASATGEAPLALSLRSLPKLPEGLSLEWIGPALYIVLDREFRAEEIQIELASGSPMLLLPKMPALPVEIAVPAADILPALRNSSPLLPVEGAPLRWSSALAQPEEGDTTLLQCAFRKKAAVAAPVEAAGLAEWRLIAEVSPGAVEQRGLLRLTCTQGEMKSLRLELPEGLSVTRIADAKGRPVSWTSSRDGASIWAEMDFAALGAGQSRDFLVEARHAAATEGSAFPVLLARPLGLTRTGGQIALGSRARLKLEPLTSEGLVRIASADPMLQESGLTQSFFFTFAELPVKLSARAEAVNPVLDSDLALQLLAKDSLVAARLRLQVDIREAEIRELLLEIGPGLDPAKVTASDLASWDLIEEKDTRLLRLVFARPVSGRREAEILAECRLAPGQDSLQLPRFALRGVRSERGTIALETQEGFTADLVKPEGLVRQPPPAQSVGDRPPQSVWRFRDASWQAELKLSRLDPALRCETLHSVTVGENTAAFAAVLTYHVAGAPCERFDLELPADIGECQLHGAHNPRLVHEGGKRSVVLQKPVLGDYTLLISWETAVAARKSEIRIGQLRPLGVLSDDGFIAVSGSQALSVSGGQADAGIVETAVDSLPAEYLALHRHPVLKAWRFLRGPHSIAVDIEARDYAALMSLVVERAELKSVLDEKGSLTGEMKLTVKNSSHPHLALRLPQGAELWTVEVQGRKVRAAADGDRILIPIPRIADPNLSFPVSIEYAQRCPPLADGVKLKIEAPSLEADVVLNDLAITLPGGWSLDQIEGARPVSGLVRKNPAPDLATLAGQLMSDCTPLLFVSLALGFLLALTFRGEWSAGPRVAAGSLSLVCVILLFQAFAEFSKLSRYSHHSSEVSHSELKFSRSVVKAGDAVRLEAVAVDQNASAERGQARVKTPLLLAALLALLGGCFLRPAPARIALGAAAAGLAIFAVQGVPMAESLLVLALLCTGLAGLGALSSHGLTALILRRRAAAALLAFCLLPALAPSGRADESQAPQKPWDSIKLELKASLGSKPDGKPDWQLSGETTWNRHDVKEDDLLPFALPGAILFSQEVPKEAEFLAERRLLKAKDDGALIATQKLGLLVRPSPPDELALEFPACPALIVELGVELPGDDWEILNHSPLARARLSVEGKTSRLSVLLPRQARSAVILRRKPAQSVAEKPVLFAEVASAALCGEGFVTLLHRVDVELARGQMKTLQLKLPARQVVTRVDGGHAWSWDPKSGQLEIALAEKFSGKASFLVRAQMPAAKDAELSVESITVPASSTSRGRLFLCAEPGIAFRLSGSRKTAPDDDAKGFVALFPELAAHCRGEALFNGYRHLEGGAALQVKLAAVVPEISVDEQSSLSLGDERGVLSSVLTVHIEKAPVFSLELSLPAGYEIESLEAPGLARWDELGRGVNRRCLLTFADKVRGDIPLRLVLVQAEPAAAGSLVLPSCGVKGELRRGGRYQVAAERGQRLAPVPGSSGIGSLALPAEGVAAFPVLKPGWKASLQRSLLAPRIEAEYLQTLKVRDDQLQLGAVFLLKIENAPVRSLRIQAPASIAALDVKGADISRVDQLGDGLWQIEFGRKIFGECRLEVACQTWVSGGIGQVQPLLVEGIERQRGHLLVHAPSETDVALTPRKGALTKADPRLLPPQFASAEAGLALHCLRSGEADYRIDLKLSRRAEAKQLAASVSSVEIHTLAALDGACLCRALIQLLPGSKTELTVRLPAGSSLASAFVNSSPVLPVQQQGNCLIPLPRHVKSLEIELVWSQKAKIDAAGRWSIPGPSFDLPLKNIRWNLFTPPEIELDPRTLGGSLRLASAAQLYPAKTPAAVAQIDAATLLKQGALLARKGQRDEAAQRLNQAVQLSQGLSDLNEDARVQYQALLSDNTTAALVNRRANLRARGGSQKDAESFANQSALFNKGNFSDAYARELSKQLDDEDASAMGRIAERLATLQRSADDAVLPLRLSLPEEGNRLQLYREVLIDPSQALQVDFATKLEPAELPSSPSRNLWIIPLLALLASLVTFLRPLRKE
ncbi:MAG: hypothetical protein RL095_1921 [Verrucomicrobiota bacterium]|jgi:hypothetical protein